MWVCETKFFRKNLVNQTNSKELKRTLSYYTACRFQNRLYPKCASRTPSVFSVIEKFDIDGFEFRRLISLFLLSYFKVFPSIK